MVLTSNNIKNPGLKILPPGIEKYFVKGGGLSVIEVSPEDTVEIINEEGKQICEIIVFNSKGKSDLPFELKTIISQICLPSSLMISILSSAETSITERPPPLT